VLLLCAQDLVRFFQTFVLLNLYKEVGRTVIVSASYYPTVADVAVSGLNRDVAIAPVVSFMTMMSIVFRLEVSDYDDPMVALVTCLLQGVLEVALRVTAPERDEAIKLAFRRLRCGWLRCGRKKRRSTVLVVASASVAPLDSSKKATTTGERLAAQHERTAIV
jgi:hypothetical protein